MSTKTVEQNAREFWLENSPYGSGASTYAVPYHHKDWLKTIYRDDAIHVIEYSAFEELKKRLEDAEMVIKSLIVPLNTAKKDYSFMETLLSFENSKDEAIRDCRYRMTFRKPMFNALDSAREYQKRWSLK